MSKDLFRKEALDKISSRELLRRPINITAPLSWILLLGILILVAGISLWGFLGKVEITILIEGMLVQGGGYGYVYSVASGQIYDIGAQTGEWVHKGAIVARIDQPDLVEEVLSLQSQLEWSPERADLQDQLTRLQSRLRRESWIVSLEEGRVSEVLIHRGQVVHPGDPVLKVVRTGEHLMDMIAVLFVPIQQGKQILPGMTVRIAPSTVVKEEYGYLLGNVVSVSDLPVTAREVAAQTGSELLAQRMTDQIVLEVRVDLIPSDHTMSGYAWTSKDGPPIILESGTLVQGWVITRAMRPIDLVFPQMESRVSQLQKGP